MAYTNINKNFQSLEESLWIEETRFDAKYMNSILADDFFEFGRSGKIYNRDEILNIPIQEIHAILPLQNFQIRSISENVTQVTYVSRVKCDDVIQFANRSSIWVKRADIWKLYFHQGTPVH